MKTVVTGSLGNISKPLATALVQKGHTVTVISSNHDREKDIEALGAKAILGSVEDGDFLTSVFTGADAVYTMVPPDFTAPGGPIAHYRIVGNAYERAIRHSGVKRVVHLSSWGAHLKKGTGVIVGSHYVEEALNELPDVAITYLRPCSFYNNLYHYIDMIKEAGFIGTNYGGDDKLVLVSPLDIAAAAVEEIEANTPGKKIRYVASDEHTCNEIAAVLGTAIGKPDLKWIIFTDTQTQAAMEQQGVPALIAEALVELNASIRSGAIREDYDLHQPVMGKVKLDDFAKEFAVAYHQK
jgi:uncharacterized protein YbjT (DUF2867 family)